MSEEFDVEVSKKIILDEQNKIIDAATKEFTEFVESWSKKYNCIIEPVGDFSGNKMNNGIQITLKK